MTETRELTIGVGWEQTLSGLLLLPDAAKACFVFAHGAGAGMHHKSMQMVADGLADRGIATLRYQFPYMEAKSRRPDPPKVAHAAVRAAIDEAGRLCPATLLFAGGRSFGGRMTSQAQAVSPLPNVRGLIFLGFPLHPSGKPSIERADHLSSIKLPMLFLQGSRDALSELELLLPIIDALRPLASLHLLQDADHSFHVPARTGRKDAESRTEMLDVIAEWVGKVSAG